MLRRRLSNPLRSAHLQTLFVSSLYSSAWASSSRSISTTATADTYKNNSDSALPDTSMAYTYAWYDGARIATTTYDKDTGSSNTLWDSTYAYDGLGRIASVDIDDGRRRTVSFAYTPEGQIVRRKERSAASTNPEDMRYFASGRQIGELTNNGYEDPSIQNYAKSLVLRNRTDNPVATPFRWNTMSPSTGGNFGTSNGYNALNPYGDGAGTSGSSYTVREGDTLQGIAASIWGDASLWYLIAEANGMAGGSALIAGQSLAVPDRVTNARNNAGTFDVYDPSRALGDLNPTTPKPAKANKCGMMGQMLVMLVAVAVAALLPEIAPALFVKTGILGAMGAAAISSGASQAFAVASGIQDRFDWKGVALSTISAGVGSAMGPGGMMGKFGAFGNASSAVQDTLRGALGSVITQGIGVATGLQDKFSWAGVAGAGVVAGVSGAVTRGLTPRGPLALHETLQGNPPSPSFAAVQAGGAAGALAGAAARSIITGTSFGDNIMAVLPDVIASTIGNALVAGVMANDSRDPTGEAALDEPDTMHPSQTSAGATAPTAPPAAAPVPAAGTSVRIANYRRILGDEASDSLELSDLFRQDIRSLRGYRLEVGREGGGTYIDGTVIYIDRGLLASPGPSMRQLIWALGHELGHGRDRTASDYSNRNNFIRGELRNEARAEWHGLTIIAQINEARPGKIPLDNIPGAQGQFLAIFQENYATMRSQPTRAVQNRMSDIYAGLNPSGRPTITYREKYNANYDRDRAFFAAQRDRLAPFIAAADAYDARIRPRNEQRALIRRRVDELNRDLVRRGIPAMNYPPDSQPLPLADRRRLRPIRVPPP